MYANQIKTFEEHTSNTLEYTMNSWLATHPTEARNIHYLGPNQRGFYCGYVVHQVYTEKKIEQADTEKAG